VELQPVPAELDGTPRAPGSTTLRDALSLMLTESATGVVVLDADGQPKGYLTVEDVSGQL